MTIYLDDFIEEIGFQSIQVTDAISLGIVGDAVSIGHNQDGDIVVISADEIDLLIAKLFEAKNLISKESKNES